MSTSAIGTVLDSIRAGLVARSGLSGVNIFSAFVSIEEGGLESIELGPATLTEEEMAMGGAKLETWTVEGYLMGQAKTWQGTTETTIKAGRDRSLALFAEVETYINQTYLPGTYPYVAIAAGKMESGYNTEARATRLDFSLTVLAVKNP